MRSHRTEILNINLREEIFVKTNAIFKNIFLIQQVNSNSCEVLVSVLYKGRTLYDSVIRQSDMHPLSFHF